MTTAAAQTNERIDVNMNQHFELRRRGHYEQRLSNYEQRPGLEQQGGGAVAGAGTAWPASSEER